MVDARVIPNKTQQNVKRDQEIQKFAPIIGGIFALFFIVAIVIVAMGAGKEKTLIRPKITDFFTHLDSKDYGYIYDSLFCESFKKETKRLKFIKRMEQAAKNLGALSSRGKGDWQTGTGEEASVYLIEFESQYAKGSVKENLTFKKEDGNWCLSEYGGTRPSTQSAP